MFHKEGAGFEDSDHKTVVGMAGAVTMSSKWNKEYVHVDKDHNTLGLVLNDLARRTFLCDGPWSSLLGSPGVPGSLGMRWRRNLSLRNK